jgi:hypothetical protein
MSQGCNGVAHTSQHDRPATTGRPAGKRRITVHRKLPMNGAASTGQSQSGTKPPTIAPPRIGRSGRGAQV